MKHLTPMVSMKLIEKYVILNYSWVPLIAK